MRKIQNMSGQVPEVIYDQLQRLTTNEFVTEEVRSWLTTPAEDLVMAQAPYIIAGNISGELPSRYSVPDTTRRHPLDPDPLLKLLDIRYPLYPSHDPGDAPVNLELDTREALLGSTALSELTYHQITSKPPVLAEALHGVTHDALIPDRIELLKQKIDLYKLEEATRTEARRLRLRAASTARLARTAFAPEPSNMGGSSGVGNSAKGRWVAHFDYVGRNGGGTPGNPMRVNTSRK